jgi:hypothetical protein
VHVVEINGVIDHPKSRRKSVELRAIWRDFLSTIRATNIQGTSRRPCTWLHAQRAWRPWWFSHSGLFSSASPKDALRDPRRGIRRLLLRSATINQEASFGSQAVAARSLVEIDWDVQ